MKNHLQALPPAQPFRMIFIPGGPFFMGSQNENPSAQNFDEDAYGDEQPVHEVTVGDFWMAEFPVTQDVWRAVMGINLSFFQGNRRPVENISWDDVHLFIQKLNQMTQKSRPGNHFYRLPSEAEWEFAARGGAKKADDFKYAGSDKLREVGWFADNSHGETKPVGLKEPNDLGLFDMSGNVWEWCEDDYHGDYKNNPPTDGLAWVDSPERGLGRVSRGGNWDDEPRGGRATFRFNYWVGPAIYLNGIGCRLVLAFQGGG